MLNTIKDLINQKQAYLEAAQLMLEDTELDDSIVLDESPMEIPPEEKTEEAENEAPEEVSSDETVVEEEQPLPMEDDELPTTPAAEPTGEPVSDDSADIMTAEIDLATNTQTDILPVPPANANDAIDGEGDILSQTVDSGFGDDEDKPAITNTADIMDDPIDEPEVKASDDKNKDDLDINTPVGESDDLLNEAVDDIMDESVDDDNMEKSIEEKEKDYLKSYKESDDDSDDIMDEPIDEAVDDDKIKRSIEEKEKEYNKSYKESVFSDEDDWINESFIDDGNYGEEFTESADADTDTEESDEESDELTESTFDDDVFNEAISLGDDSAADAGSDTSSNASDAPDASAAPAEDNAVTSAVKDKVDEMSSTDDYSGSSSSATDKEELMKKLSSLTKSIEDAKALVLKGLQ